MVTFLSLLAIAWLQSLVKRNRFSLSSTLIPHRLLLEIWETLMHWQLFVFGASRSLLLWLFCSPLRWCYNLVLSSDSSTKPFIGMRSVSWLSAWFFPHPSSFVSDLACPLPQKHTYTSHSRLHFRYCCFWMITAFAVFSLSVAQLPEAAFHFARYSHLEASPSKSFLGTWWVSLALDHGPCLVSGKHSLLKLYKLFRAFRCSHLV